MGCRDRQPDFGSLLLQQRPLPALPALDIFEDRWIKTLMSQYERPLRLPYRLPSSPMLLKRQHKRWEVDDCPVIAAGAAPLRERLKHSAAAAVCCHSRPARNATCLPGAALCQQPPPPPHQQQHPAAPSPRCYHWAVRPQAQAAFSTPVAPGGVLAPAVLSNPSAAWRRQRTGEQVFSAVHMIRPARGGAGCLSRLSLWPLQGQDVLGWMTRQQPCKLTVYQQVHRG